MVTNLNALKAETLHYPSQVQTHIQDCLHDTETRLIHLMELGYQLKHLLPFLPAKIKIRNQALDQRHRKGKIQIF